MDSERLMRFREAKEMKPVRGVSMSAMRRNAIETTGGRTREAPSYNSLHSERVLSNVFLILRKTREWCDEWPVCRSRAFVRRASTHVNAFGPNRDSLDPVPETTRLPLRIIDAFCAGRSGSSHFPCQHNGHAYAESAGGSTRQPVRDRARGQRRPARFIQSYVDREC